MLGWHTLDSTESKKKRKGYFLNSNFTSKGKLSYLKCTFFNFKKMLQWVQFDSYWTGEKGC